MFKIKGNGVIWDGENDRPLVTFKKGEFVTEDQEIAEKLHDMGFEVEGIFEEKKPAEVEIQDDALDDKTVAELKKIAKDNSIDIGEATKKADILAAIKAVEKPQEEEK